MKLPKGKITVYFLFAAVTSLLSGCGSTGYAPVSDKSIGPQPPPKVYSTKPRISSTIPKYYYVRPGDTLYSIAFRYGKELQALARANEIDSSYTIYPGQRIYLTEAAAPRPAPKAAPRSPQPATKTTPAVESSNIRWGWPARGAVIQSFSARGDVNKGINIAGRQGDPVVAAADGVVVYAGSGLLGYGNLIIVNHNKEFLSAYAHNSKILVKEQQKVKKGSKIAEIGNSGTTKSMLHFEIRRNGKPVNPVRYLPSR